MNTQDYCKIRKEIGFTIINCKRLHKKDLEKHQKIRVAGPKHKIENRTPNKLREKRIHKITLRGREILAYIKSVRDYKRYTRTTLGNKECGLKT